MIDATLLAQSQGLTAGGWTVMIGCIGLVCGLCVYCYWRILREPTPSEYHHAPLDIEPFDQDR